MDKLNPETMTFEFGGGLRVDEDVVDLILGLPRNGGLLM
jgi:hypothetical protein